MPLLVNVRQLETSEVLLQGELSAAELGWETRDDMIRVREPLEYDLRVRRLEQGIWVQGRLRQVLDCNCVRCLRSFAHPVVTENWTCEVPLEGDDAAPLVNDSVDLTPYLRDDIFLAFPQHPLCTPDCDGLGRLPSEPSASGGESRAGASVWEELDKLKL